MLNVKRITAPARTADVRVIELESGAMKTFDVIHFGAVHIHETCFVDKYFQAVEFENVVALIVETFVKAHPVLKSRTAAPDDLNSQSGIVFRLLVQDLLNFF